MFCQKCGNQNAAEAAFCSKCGTSFTPQASTFQSLQPSFAAPKPTSAGNTFSTIGIICGIVAFLFIPIVFGPAAIVLGAVGKSKGEEKAVVAMAVGAVGLVVGMILGVLVFSAL